VSITLIMDGIDLDALNYTIKVPYNGTVPTGGDSLNADLNIFYDVSYAALTTGPELAHPLTDPTDARLVILRG
jgi:hypothetical protein